MDEEEEEYEPGYTDEDIDRMSNSPEGYIEELQYVRRTHTSKEEARENKKEACRKYGWSSHRFFFHELVDSHGMGVTVRHIPPAKGKPWSTRYLFVDIDNHASEGYPEPQVTADELTAVLPGLGYPAYGFTRSTSLAPYKWHVLLFLDTPARTKDEYGAAMDEADTRLREAIAGLRGGKPLPRLADPEVYWQSTLYGPSQEKSAEVVLKDLTEMPGGSYAYTPDLPHRERVNCSPEPKYLKDDMEAGVAPWEWKVPLTTPGFAKWLHLRGLSDSERIDDMEYDFNIGNVMPYLRKGRTKDAGKIPEGTRHDGMNVFCLKLYAQWRSYNLWLDEHGLSAHRFTEECLVNSMLSYLDNAFETYGGYDLDEHARFMRVLIYRNAGTGDREYLESIVSHSTGRHSFRTRAYTKETAEAILDSMRDSEGNVRFESVAFRDSFLKDRKVSLATLRKAAASLGVKVVTGRSSGGNRAGSGRKATVTWESLGSKGEVREGVFEYRGKLTPAEKMFLSRNSIRMKKKE